MPAVLDPDMHLYGWYCPYCKGMEVPVPNDGRDASFECGSRQCASLSGVKHSEQSDECRIRCLQQFIREALPAIMFLRDYGGARVPNADAQRALWDLAKRMHAAQRGEFPTT